jgi:DNA repair protein RadC
MSRKNTTKASDQEALDARYQATSKTPTLVRKVRISSSGEVFAQLDDIRSADREHFVVFDLNVRHQLIERRIVAIGSLTGVEVHPREVFRGAIANGAAALVMAHNHPSGDPTPSRQDLELTTRLKEVGALCGISVLDHVVVAADGYTSLAERGWL